MIKYCDQLVHDETCPKRLGPKEHANIFRYTQNVFVSELEFIRCDLTRTGLTTYATPVRRSSASNIRLVDCRAEIHFGIGAIFDDVCVDGFRTGRHPVILDACAFRHVVVKGECGCFILNRNVCHDDEERNAAFIAANEEFYRSVDWALDISEICASSFEVRGSIPVELIRRNPNEHFIMTREVAQSGDWKFHEPYDSFSIAIGIFLDSGTKSNLFVAPRRSKKFKEELEFYRRLKGASLVS